MVTKSFNSITETYTVKRTSDSNELLDNIFDEVSVNDNNRDLVLICGQEKLPYHAEVVAAVFPFVKKFVQNSKSCPCSHYLQTKAEMFISLDGVDPVVFKQIMSCIYGNKPMKFSRQILGEVRDIFRMLGADDKLFSVEKGEIRKPEARNGDVFRNVLGGATANPLDIPSKRKSSDGEELNRIAKKRVVDINMKDDEKESVPEKEELANATVDDKQSVVEVEETISEQVTVNAASEKVTVYAASEKFTVNAASEQVTVNAVSEQVIINTDEVSVPAVIEQVIVEPVEKEIPASTTDYPVIPAPIPDEIVLPVAPVVKEPASALPKLKDNNLQMILPHLTVTTIKQEPNESTDSPTQPTIKTEPTEYAEGSVGNVSSDPSVLRCPLANCSSDIVFKTRSEILLHLTQVHYTEGLTDLFPFNKGQPCKICVDERRPKVFISQIKPRHIAHIGVNHEVVLDLLPAELKEVLMALPKRMKRPGTPVTPQAKPEIAITLDEAPGSATPAPVVSTQPFSSNYYPNNTSYSQPSQAASNYSEQSNYTAPPTYTPATNYPNYNNYYQYQPPSVPASEPVTSVPAYPSYPEYSHETSISSQGKPELGSKTEEQIKNAVKVEAKVEVKQELLDKSDTVFKCTLCTARSFEKRADLLFHLSITHFSRNLNQMYPFIDRQVCTICNQFTPKNMSSHISHMGLKHEEVLKFLPADLASTLTTDSGDANSSAKTVENVATVEPTAPKPTEDKFVQKPTENLTGAAPVSEEPTVQCSMCKANNKERLFTKRSEFLKHLSLLHYGKALLHAFPFAEGKNCNLCFETSKKMYTPSKKEVHVCHVGVLHAKIFELLPKEILQQVMQMPTMKKTMERPVQNQQPVRNRGEQQQHHTQQLQGVSIQSVRGDHQFPSQLQSAESQFGSPNIPLNNPNQNFPQLTSHPVGGSPRDVSFKLPSSNLPAKEDFKMPMVKTEKPYNCRYCVSGFDVAKDLKDHLLTHKSQFSQINQTPRKAGPGSLVNLRMNTPRK